MFSRKLNVACALLVAAPAIAQTRFAPADPAADRLVAEALHAAPEIRSAAAGVEAARLRVTPARTLPDPRASLTYQKGNGGGLMLTQALPWPGKLALSGDIAKSEAREAEAGMLSRAQRTIEARVRRAWYDLLLANAIDHLVDERRATAAQIEASARERYAAGIGVQQDVLRAQVELSRIDEMKASQRAAIRSTTAEINRLIGRPQDTPIDAPADLPPPAALPPADAVVAAIAASSPEIAAASQRVETSQLGVRLARKNFLPDFAVNAGSMQRSPLDMGPMWQASIGVSIPAWIDRRQQNQLAESQALVAASRADAEEVRQQLELRTREIIAEIAASDEAAVLYRDKIVPLDELSLESAMASYAAGKVPFVTVLDAVNTLYSDRTMYRTRLAESAKSRVSLEEAR